MKMNELFEKLTSYNIFNHLFPGFLFAGITSRVTEYNFIDQNIFLSLSLCYFYGLVISRIGSLFIEPNLKRIRFVSYANYSDFLDASKRDPKISKLSEANNMYRTLSSMFLMILAIKGFEYLSTYFPNLNVAKETSILFVFLALFLFSYRKQTQYIYKRVKKIKL